LTIGYEPIYLQILHVITLLDSPENFERLAQINTRAGMSTIIAMSSSIQALLKHKIDVITSCDVLAVRDAISLNDFYSLLGLTVSHNINKGFYCEKKMNCYLQDVVYGTSSSFQFEILLDEYKGIINRRKADIRIVHETDSITINELGS